MMRRRIFLLILILLTVGSASAYATEVTSTDLIERASDLDGASVLYTGELIGDAFLRGNHVWLNVADANNAVGIWADRAVMASLTTFGRYGQTGDRLQIKGTFHRACQEHGGDLDIHAEQIVVLEKGRQSEQAISYPLLMGAVAFILVDVLILVLYRKQSRSVNGR